MVSKIIFREFGQGPLLIMLHGYGGSLRQWEPLVQELSKHHRVIIPNLSHLMVSESAIRFSDQLIVLKDFFEKHFHGEKLTLAGMSYGGALSWAYALEFPDQVESVILLNPLVPHPILSFKVELLKRFFRLPLTNTAAYMILRTPIGKLLVRKAAEIFRDERVHLLSEQMHGRRLLFVTHLFQRFSWLIRTENWKSWDQKLEHWGHRSILIYDRQDPLIKEEKYQEFQRLLSSESVVVLDGAGHIATHSAAPRITKEILLFLSKQQKNSA